MLNHDDVRLYHGDCLDLMRNIPDASIDMILCDPPYGTTACKWDVVIPFESMWGELKRIIKPDGVIALFGSEPFSSLMRCSNLKGFRYDWIWEKPNATGFLNAKIQPLRAHETISIFYSKKPTYNPQKTQGHKRKQSERVDIDSECYGKAIKRVAYDSTERYPRTIQVFASDKQVQSLHPTQKPVALLEYLVKTYTDENETILDFTMGSGSTGMACIKNNRKFVGIEKEEEYFNIAKKRIFNNE